MRIGGTFRRRTGPVPKLWRKGRVREALAGVLPAHPFQYERRATQVVYADVVADGSRGVRFGVAERLDRRVDAAVAAESAVVGAHQHPVAPGSRYGYRIVREAVLRMPVEYEDDGAVTEHQRLVVGVHLLIVGVAVRKDAVSLDQREHRLVEPSEVRVAQKPVYGETPLPPRIRIAPAVALARDARTRCP